MIRAGIFGATGYTGYELVKLLERHPQVEIAFATSHRSAGKTLDAIYPSATPLPLIDGQAADVDSIDVAFLCLPHAASAETAVRCLDAGCRVIDLSADFRLQDQATYETWYKVSHPAPHLLEHAVYGLTEVNRTLVAEADLVACPGCYPTSILLPLYPLLKAGAISGTLIADAKSGVSGAGRKAKVDFHFVEVGTDLRPYGIGRKHRHLPEMEQAIGTFTTQPTKLIFSPHLIPIPRGIVSTIYADTARSLEDNYRLLHEAYAKEPFIKLLPLHQNATIQHAVNTNRCVIGLTEADGTLILTSAIDNLIKGSGGQGVQNFNLMFGFEETLGLR